MQLSIKGRPGSMTLKEVRYVMNYWANILFGKRLANNIYIEVRFMSLGGDYGSVVPVDLEKNGREFELLIEKDLTKEECLQVLAHEMEHIRQFARGELVNEHDTLYRWQGAYYRETKKNYERMPWERQAQRSEPWLMRFYEEHCQIYSLSF